MSVPQENKLHHEKMRYTHKTINYTNKLEVLRLLVDCSDVLYTNIKTELMFVCVHLYNTVDIISPPFLKIHVLCGSVDLLLNIAIQGYSQKGL